MLMTDGKYYVEIELKVWESFDIGYGDDISEMILSQYASSFFMMDADTPVYIVANVDTILDMARDWKLNREGFANDIIDILDKHIWYTFKSLIPIRLEVDLI